jgi:hypothetical protein
MAINVLYEDVLKLGDYVSRASAAKARRENIDRSIDRGLDAQKANAQIGLAQDRLAQDQVNADANRTAALQKNREDNAFALQGNRERLAARKAELDAAAAADAEKSRIQRQQALEDDDRNFQQSQALIQQRAGVDWEQSGAQSLENDVKETRKAIVQFKLNEQGKPLAAKLLGKLDAIKKNRNLMSPSEYSRNLAQWQAEANDAGLEDYVIKEPTPSEDFASAAVNPFTGQPLNMEDIQSGKAPPKIALRRYDSNGRPYFQIEDLTDPNKKNSPEIDFDKQFDSAEKRLNADIERRNKAAEEDWKRKNLHRGDNEPLLPPPEMLPPPSVDQIMEEINKHNSARERFRRESEERKKITENLEGFIGGSAAMIPSNLPAAPQTPPPALARQPAMAPQDLDFAPAQVAPDSDFKLQQTQAPAPQAPPPAQQDPNTVTAAAGEAFLSPGMSGYVVIPDYHPAARLARREGAKVYPSMDGSNRQMIPISPEVWAKIGGKPNGDWVPQGEAPPLNTEELADLDAAIDQYGTDTSKWPANVRNKFGG